MPNLSTDADLNDLSDEDYLVQKAKETLASNPYQSKAWTLTARTLFPQNFDIQVYIIEYFMKCFT